MPRGGEVMVVLDSSYTLLTFTNTNPFLYKDELATWHWLVGWVSLCLKDTNSKDHVVCGWLTLEQEETEEIHDWRPGRMSKGEGSDQCTPSTRAKAVRRSFIHPSIHPRGTGLPRLI